jgi:hypothetical protein
MLLDPISTGELILLVEGRIQRDRESRLDEMKRGLGGGDLVGQGEGEEEGTGLEKSYSMALEFLFSKREACIFHPGRLHHLKSLPLTEWSPQSPIPQEPIAQSPPSAHLPADSTPSPTRRTRLRLLRSQWRISHPSPAKLVRRVRFAAGEGVFDEETGEEYVTAPERMSLGSRSSSIDSSLEEWFVAPQEQREQVERARSVGGLIREGRIREEGVVEEGNGMGGEEILDDEGGADE